MSRMIRGGLIQCAAPLYEGQATLAELKRAMEVKQLRLIEEAGRRGVQVLCLQALFNTPYFCPAQEARWLSLAEVVPGPSVELLQPLARRYQMVIVAPVFEKETAGVYYNTAVVIDADGSYLGKYRKVHIPHTSGFWEKFYFKPGNLGFPVFNTRYAKVGICLCYDRHFPEGPRILGLKGAELVFNPSTTVAGLSQHLWTLENPAHAVMNGYFVGAVNRVGTEPPWNLGRFYGSSYFVDPRGSILSMGAEDRDEVVVGDLNLELIDEVRNTWQFYRDRRPEVYAALTQDIV